MELNRSSHLVHVPACAGREDFAVARGEERPDDADEQYLDDGHGSHHEHGQEPHLAPTDVGSVKP